MKRRILSIILSISVLSISLPKVWAAESYEDGLCPHHREHTEDCGYIEAVAGAPCAHEHTDDCYALVEVCVHVHNESCYSDTDETEPTEDEVSVGSEGTGALENEDENTETVTEETEAPEEEDGETDIGTEEAEAPEEEDGEPDIGTEEAEVSEEEDGEPDIGTEETEVSEEEDGEPDIGTEEAETPEDDDEETVIRVEEDGALEEDGGRTEICGHVCTMESGCVTLVENCAHVHDESCGYIEPVEGAPCGFVCYICAGLPDETETAGNTDPAKDPEGTTAASDEALNAVQTMIDALPASEDVLTMDEVAQDDIYRLMRDAYNAYSKLTEEQQARITGLDNFYALLDFFDKQMAQTSVSTAYRDASGNTVDRTAAVVKSSDFAVTWTEGWYVVNSDVTISGTVTVSGDVNLILGDGCTLITTESIRVAGNGNSLSIYCQSQGTGALIAGAAGTDSAIDCGRGGGTLLIYGGTVKANGSGNAAGIGSGGSVQTNNEDFYVGIYGGHVIARAGGEETDSYGIGSGGNSDVSVHLVMTGGVVEAYGANSGVPHWSDVTGGVLIANFSDGLPSKEGGLIVDTKSGNGKMYSSAVLNYDATFPSNCTVDIPGGMILTVTAALTNKGSITGDGKIDVTDGILYNSDKIGSTVRIEPSNKVYTITPPTAKDGLTYDGSAKQLINSGSISNGGGKILYSLDGDAYSEAIPTGTNPKTYNVYYKVVPSADTGAFSGPLSGTISVTVTGYPDSGSISQTNTVLPVADAELRIELPDIEVYIKDTLDDSYLVGAKAFGSDNEEVEGTFSITGGITTWSTIGTKKETTVTFTPKAPSSYQPVSVTATVTVIKRKVLYPDRTIGDITKYSYGTELSEITELINLGSIDWYVTGNPIKTRLMSVIWDEDTYDSKTLKEQTVIGRPNISIAPDELENPYEAHIAVKIKLQPLEPGKVDYKPKEATYTGDTISHELGDIEGVKSITYEYEGTGNTKYGPSPDAPINAGTYKVTAEFDMEDGYDQIPDEDKESTLTIKPKPITGADITVTNYESYTGQTQTPEVSVSLEGKPLTYDSEYSYTITKNGESEIKNAGTYTVTVKGTGNYTGTAQTTFEILKASPKIAFREDYDPGKVYDRVPISDPTSDNWSITGVTYGNKDVSVVWKSSPGMAVISNPKDAGEYFLEITLLETINTNSSNTVQKKVIIDPKEVNDPEIKLDQDKFTYDGNPHKPNSIKVMDGNDEIPTDEYDIKYDSDDVTNVRTVTITVEDREGGNYIVSGSTTYAITRAELKADMFKFTPPTDLIYTGDKKTATVELNSAYDEKGVGQIIKIRYFDESDTEVDSPTKVGTYTVKIDVSEGANYKKAEGLTDNWTFTIKYLDAPPLNEAYTVSGGHPVGDVLWVNENETVTITPATGYTISAELEGKYDTFLSVKNWTSGDVIYLKNASGYITGAIPVTETVKTDSQSPVGSIKIKDKSASWDSTPDNITFGLFYLGGQTLVAEADDKESGVKSFDYHLSIKGPVKTEEIIDSDWFTFNGSVSLPGDGKYVLYVRIIDRVGHATYISSDGIVIYTDAEMYADSIKYTKTTKDPVDAEVRSNGNTIREIRIDGTIISNTNYTTDPKDDENKVTSITFKGEWLDTLAAGDHTLTVYYNPLGEEYKEAVGSDVPAATEIALKVLKADQATLEIINLPDKVMIYDDTFTLETDGGSGTGKVTWSVEKGSATVDENTGKVTITGVGDVKIVAVKAEDDEYYSARAEITFTVKPKEVTVDKVEVLGGPSFTYAEGKEIKPDIIAWYGDKVIPASEYTVEYSNNIEVGTATITIINKAGGNYIVNGGRATFVIEKATWAEPGVLVNYIDEILVSTDTTNRTIEFADDPNGPWTPFTDGMSVVESEWDIADNVIYIRFREDDNHVSEIQELFIPARRDIPHDRIAVTKSATGIIINNTAEHDGLEYSIDEKNWNESGLFPGLKANTEYTLYIRYKPIDPVFRSRIMTLSYDETQGAFASYSTLVIVITPTEDGRTVLMPNETVEKKNGEITNNKDDVTVTDEEGNILGTIDPPEGEDFADGIEIGNDDDVVLPDGSTFHPGNGDSDITVGPGNGGILDKDGNVILPGGGQAQLGDTTVTAPENGGTLKPDDNGRVDLPAGSVVEKDGQVSTIPERGGFYDSKTGETHPNYYIVTLVRHATDIEEIRIYYGDKFVKPADPIRPGYDFNGWYTDPDFDYDSRYDFSLPVTQDFTLYAYWIEEEEPEERKKVVSGEKDESPRTGSNIALHMLLTGISGLIAMVIALRNLRKKKD